MNRRHLLAGIAGVGGAAGIAAGGALLVGDGADGTIGSDGSTDGDGPGDRPFEPLGHVDVEGARELVVGDDGTTGYLAVNDGVATIDLGEPAEPAVLAQRRDLLADEPGGPLAMLWDVAVDGDRLLAVGPAQELPGAGEPAAVLLDVADPADPTVLDAIRPGHAIHNCTLEGGYAYLTGSGLPETPLVIHAVEGDAFREVARWSLLDLDPAWDEVHHGLRELHDVTVADGVAFLPYWDAGTYLLDVSDPGDPAYLGHVADRDPETLAEIDGLAVQLEVVAQPGNSHYVDVGDDGDLMAVGRESWAVPEGDCATGGPGGVDLYDVGDPTAIDHVGRIDPPESYSNLQNGWFTTAHNFELTGGRLYSSWYFGGVRVHDVTTPSAPDPLAWWREPEETAFWTAERIAGGAFAASSADDAAGYADGIPGRVYTFPDRPGQQPDPPSLTDPPAGEEPWPEC